MTKLDWLAFAKENEQKLCRLMHNYHPFYRKGMHPKMHITAQRAERACEFLRREIVQSFQGDTPVDAFKFALESGHAPLIYTLMNETWIGVPESTAAYQIDGFNECCELLEGWE